jgi:hypothetical protein
MFRRTVLLALAVLLLPALASLCAQPPNHEKSTWNFDGGLPITTDGSIPSGPCFHLSGRATAPDFFDNLKREDSNSGSFLHRGSDIVTEYPANLHLNFLMYDEPCQFGLTPLGTRVYLTRAIVSNLRLSFFWKHGLKMRPAEGIQPGHYETRRVLPYASELADQLPEKFEWRFEFDVPSQGVPVTDSLVVIMLTADGHIAARAAARM